MNRFSQGAVYNLQGDGEITSIANKTGEHVLQYTNCDYHLPSNTYPSPFWQEAYLALLRKRLQAIGVSS